VANLTPTLVELKLQIQDDLIAFLQTETQLAAAFCDLFQRTQNQERRARLQGEIQKIVNTLRHFGERIADAPIRSDILREADRLSNFLVRLSGQTGSER
jgi:uncharacterized protein YhaN